MAAIPDTGGAGYAPRGVTRALVRLVVLGGLVTAGWLLGSGISHADEDPGLPGTGLTHIISLATSSDDRSGDRLGVPTPARPTIKKVLPSAQVPRLPVQSPIQAGLLRPLVNTVDATKPATKPLAQTLTSVSRPLSGTAPQRAAAQSPVPADPPAAVPATAPAAAAAVPTAAVPTAAPPVDTAVRDAAPAVALHAPAAPAADPMTVLVANGDAPVAPMPGSPPGSTTSPCVIGGTGGSTSTKCASDVAVRESWAAGSLVQSCGLSARDTSDLPGSLAAQPSTSPD